MSAFVGGSPPATPLSTSCSTVSLSSPESTPASYSGLADLRRGADGAGAQAGLVLCRCHFELALVDRVAGRDRDGGTRVRGRTASSDARGIFADEREQFQVMR